MGSSLARALLDRPRAHRAKLDRAIRVTVAAAAAYEPTWDKAHAILAENTVARANGTRAQTPALLRGLIFAPGGHAMTPSHTRKDGKLYRYYVDASSPICRTPPAPIRKPPASPK